MIIYYTHTYSRNKGESHRLLEQAIGEYLASAGHRDQPDADDRDSASRLVSLLRTTGEYGKPYIPGFAPFSISHSRNTWAVLITEEDRDTSATYPEDVTGTCGLDVQYPGRADAETVTRRFFAPADADLIAALCRSGEQDDTAAERGMTGADDAFYRLWVRREALVKAAGTSAVDADVPPVSGGKAVYRGAEYRLEEIRIPECEAYAAVCIPACEEVPGELIMRELY